MAQRKPLPTRPPSPETVPVTNAHKPMWPEVGVTKGALIEYLDLVHEPLLDELRDRPLTVVRAPDGIQGETFFQKQTPAYTPAWVDSVELPAPASRRKVVRYTVCNSRAALRWLGNQAAIELHPSTVRLPSLDRPDVLAFDLDPPPGRFDLAIEGANAIRAIVEELGLRPVLKTTGGKGLHVFVPLERRYRSDRVEAAAARVAERALDRHPALFTVEFLKRDRAGRILIDVARNGAGATIVAAFSPRAKPGAPVSFPVSWDELDGVDPARFNIARAAGLLGSAGVAEWRAARLARQLLPRALA